MGKRIFIKCLVVLWVLCSVFIYDSEAFGNPEHENSLKSKSTLLISSQNLNDFSFYKNLKGIKSGLDEAYIQNDFEFNETSVIVNNQMLKQPLSKQPKYDVSVVTEDNASTVNRTLELMPSGKPFVVLMGVGSSGHERVAYFKAYSYETGQFTEDTTFNNVPDSPIYKYRWFFIIGLPIFLIQTVLLILLVRSFRSHKRMERELQASRCELIKNNEALEVINKELTASFEEIELRGKRIHDLVYFDEVTGLHNRYSMSAFLECELSALKGRSQLAVIFFDIDNFNTINDTYGHDFGDDVLRSIGSLLKKLESPTIRVGRFGGDEFMIILRGGNLGGKVMALIDQIKLTFDNVLTFDQKNLFLSASIGVSKAPEQGKTAKALIQKADLALFEAKKSGKNRHIFYSDGLEKGLGEKVNVQTALKKAFSAGEFYVVFQPYFELETNKIVGFEALLRWEKLQSFNLTVEEMISHIEEMGLIVEIGDWVMTESCAFIQKVNAKMQDQFTVSVNVSPVQLMNIGFTERLVQLLQIYNIKPEFLCLEMTETVMIRSVEKGANILKHLRDQKFKIAIDDFGTGYSSLKYFKLLPMDVLKLDKSFIDHIDTSVYDQNLIQAMITLSHQKGIAVIAEGVENLRQKDVLILLGCDRGQGYLHSKPMREEKVFELLENEGALCGIIENGKKIKSEADYEYL